MKLLAKDLMTVVYPTGGVGLSFDATIQAKEELMKLKRGDYLIEIKKPSNKRSLNQNAYLWELIGQIDMKENGNRADDETIYANILEMAGAKSEYFQCLPEAVDKLKEVFRVVKIVENRGKTVMVQCFLGTSQMDTKEMSKVIDTTLDYAARVGIDSAYWRELLVSE